MLLEVAAYTTDIRHKPGKANNVADALSRPNGPTVLDGVVEEIIDVSLQTLDYAELARAQEHDEEIRRIFARPEHSGLKLKKVPVEDRNEIICDTGTGRDRPFLPEAWRRTAFHKIHDLEHTGIKKSKDQQGPPGHHRESSTSPTRGSSGHTSNWWDHSHRATRGS